MIPVEGGVMIFFPYIFPLISSRYFPMSICVRSFPLASVFLFAVALCLIYSFVRKGDERDPRTYEIDDHCILF